MIVLKKASDRSGALTLLPAASVFDRLLSEFVALENPRRLLNVGMVAAGADLKTIAELVLHGAVSGVYAVRTYQVAPLEGQAVASWGLDAIDARSGLDGRYEPRATGRGVRAVVVDTGISPHPDFGDRLSDDGFSAHPGGWQDRLGHGTHVASTIGGETLGVARDVILHACKALNDKGSGSTEQVIQCVDWSIDLKARTGDDVVGNMSLGGPPDPPLDVALCRALAAGVPYAVAAGNDYGDSACNSSPARVVQAFTAMASNRSDRLASFSNAGTCSDAIAPGEDIIGARPGGGSQSMSGTSMASPHMAGAIAQCLELNPGLAAGCIDEVLAWTTAGRISGVPADVSNQFLYVGKGDGEPPPPWECPIDAPWCHEMDPPQACSAPDRPCVHNPTNDPEHCELAPECPEPPPPEPQCADVEDACDCFRGEAWVPCSSAECVLTGVGALVSGHHNQLGSDVNDAMVHLTGCGVGSRCVIEERPQEWQAAVEKRLREQGLCAGQHAPHTDEIAVSRGRDAPMEGYHVYAGPGWDEWPEKKGTVVWSPGADRVAYWPVAAPPPAGCGSPAPPPIVKAKVKVHQREPQWTADGVFLVQGAAYCANWWTDGRVRCPVRPNGHPERAACELEAVGGLPVWSTTKGTCWVMDNPYLYRCRPDAVGGTVRMCDVAGRVCASIGVK
ncbi:hypothetical protein LCGC14_1503690 [marine sediment metagenome]|uniref:Peptidase S8/S53 domain-containing protein n=1 Tax=marine sediment metagenome TaxID=412755 RepID=A0A0F9M4Q5_9ZZZZ